MTHTVSATAPSPAQASINAAAQARIRRTSQDFEATFLSSMFQTMFQGVDVSQPFGGGQAETTFRSFLTDAMARSLDREAMYAVVIDPLSGYDTGTPSGWMATNALMAASDPRFASAFWDAIDERGGLMRK